MEHDFNPVRSSPPQGSFRTARGHAGETSNGIKLVIGVGNPGKVYENTYHNAGFLLIDYLLSKKPAIPNFEFRISKLLKPDVYMNESGGFVKKALKRKSSKPEEILIVHDASDLALGSWKFDFDRGSAGHKGVASVINALGTKKFWRLRIGIRPKISERAPRKKADLPAEARRAKAGEFVLKRIGVRDKKALERGFEEIGERLVL